MSDTMKITAVTRLGSQHPREIEVRDRGADTFEAWRDGIVRVMARAPLLESFGSGPQYAPQLLVADSIVIHPRPEAETVERDAITVEELPQGGYGLFDTATGEPTHERGRPIQGFAIKAEAEATARRLLGRGGPAHPAGIAFSGLWIVYCQTCGNLNQDGTWGGPARAAVFTTLEEADSVADLHNGKAHQ